MPTGILPEDDYVDHPDRTVPEMQVLFNDLFDFLRMFETELNALSDPTIREGAVRDVGTALDALPDNDELNTRIGTAGNLGTAAQRNTGTGTDDLPDVGTLNSRLGTSGNLGNAAQFNRSNSVSSTSQDSIATSYAVKLAYDRASSALSAIPSKSANGVGSYGFFRNYSGRQLGPGSTVTGSQLQWATAGGANNYGSPSGSWRCMGWAANSGATGATTVFVRYA